MADSKVARKPSHVSENTLLGKLIDVMHLLISHDFPAVPAGHAQEWSSSPSVQVPSYWHGLEAQLSGSYKKKHN